MAETHNHGAIHEEEDNEDGKDLEKCKLILDFAVDLKWIEDLRYSLI